MTFPLSYALSATRAKERVVASINSAGRRLYVCIHRFRRIVVPRARWREDGEVRLIFGVAADADAARAS